MESLDIAYTLDSENYSQKIVIFICKVTLINPAHSNYNLHSLFTIPSLSRDY
jgi:hypothetical protein